MIESFESRETKYALVGRLLGKEQGTLIDFGARDQMLKRYLADGLEYRSVDLAPGSDHQWDLDRPLPLGDRSVDVVVALDVLEHLEGIHDAFRELLRVSRRRVFLSVPNVTCLSRRLRFFLGMGLGEKHALFAAHQGDRHRWLTTWRQTRRFVEENSDPGVWAVREYALTTGYDRLHALFARLPLSRSLRAYTLLYDLERRA
jgi:SAM-dependent methyltransferase